jgi:hypothetical protein
MKAKLNKANKFMWSVIKVHMEGEDGYRIEKLLEIYPVKPKEFSNIRKAVKKYLVRGDGKFLFCILNDKDEFYKVFMFAKTTSENEFIAYEHKIADLIIKQKLDKDEQLRLF